jgi:hypothetical protein
LFTGVASQTQRPQPRSFFLHSMLFGLVLGHCFLALTQLLFLLEQCFSTTLRLVENS